jgi:predicted nucleotide-binding protein
VTKIDRALLAALERKLGTTKSNIYRLNEEKTRSSFLPRNLAAIALAAERGVNIAKFASHEELDRIRNANNSNHGIALPATFAAVGTRLPTAQRKKRQTKQTSSADSKRRGNSVFVVHGRNETLRRAFFGFLRAVGLQPIEWRKAIELTRKPSPYVGEILDAIFREAVAVIVLLTPDDEAKLKDEFLKSHNPKFEKKLTGQARPNVLFEAGMAMGRNPDSVVLVQIGDMRPFSDIGGRHVVRLSNGAESRQELITKLANAGCNVDASGSDRLREGDFHDA